MGKKSQARPGLDGVKPGAVAKATRKARRVAAKTTKAQRKKVTPGSGKKTKVTSVSELEKLRKERDSKTAASKRTERRKHLEQIGALYKATEEKNEEDAEPKVAVPPHRWNISVRKRILFCEVTLHNIPVDKVRCNMTETRMTVDTVDHSKRWLLNTEYPHGIKVDPNGLAESKKGILAIKLKITHMPDEVVKNEDKKQASIAEVRSLRFRRNAAGELVAGKKKSLEKSLLEAQKKDGVVKTPSKVAKKRKVYVDDKAKALALIEGISKEEAPKKAERKTMQDHLVDYKSERKERRVEKRARKKSMEDQAMKQIVKSKKAKRDSQARTELEAVVPTKKPTGRKVRFAKE